ncbi:hypothetical protein BGZ46_003192, partial [Entomortierella lignicola]
YAPAFEQYKDKLAVIHFVGSFKPWQWLRFADGTVFPRNTSSTDSIALVQRWWNVFDMFVGGKPSDIHEVVHGYDLPPTSQWDRVGLDGQVHEPETEKAPHYDGWFQLYTHQNQTYPTLQHEHHRQDHQQQEHHHQEHHHQEHQDQEHHHQEHYQDHQGHHHEQQQEQHHHDHQEHHHHEHQQEYHQHHQEHQERSEEPWRPPIPQRVAEGANWHHGYQEEHQHHEHVNDSHHNPHHLTDYHYHPPPPPPVIPAIPEPESHRYDPNENSSGHDERQIHQHSHSSDGTVDHENNPHHLTDYRYRLAASGDCSEGSAGESAFGKIIPEPVGLPDMYYPNAWDLPEDPRKIYPVLKPTPLEIENTTNEDGSSVPSGRGRPVFPWESNGLDTRTPTRVYYNYAATAEERRRQEKLEEERRLKAEEEALKQIREQEHARYLQERQKEEIHEKTTGGQAFENFRLVNAWDVDLGVQLSILQKTEKRKPRSRKSSAGAIRKGYGLEDMLAYEARQRQEQYEADLLRKRREEEERWVKEQEEARIKEEELRLEKLRLAKITQIRTQQQLNRQQEGSPYVFRNAWDPPNTGLTKKKIRIEDEEVDLALPLRQDRRSTQETSQTSYTSSIGRNGGSVQVGSAVRAGRGSISVAAAAAGAAGLAIAAGIRSGRVEITEDTTAEDDDTRFMKREAQSGLTQSEDTTITTEEFQSRTAGAGGSEVTTSLEAYDAVQDKSSTSTTTTTTTTTRNSDDSILATTRITSPGSIRFLRTTVTTTITHRKFKDGAEVSSSTKSSTTSGEEVFEIPPGPRIGSYFGEAGKRTITVNNSREASRLLEGVQSRSSYGALSTTRGTAEGSSSSLQESGREESSSTLSGLDILGQRVATITETKVVSRADGQITTSEHFSEVPTLGSKPTSSTITESRKQARSGLLIDTTSSSWENEEYNESSQAENQYSQRRLDLRDVNASGTAAAEAMRVLSKYPQATSRYATRPMSSSSTTNTSGSSKLSVGGVLYASDPHISRQYGEAISTFDKGKTIKAQAGYSTGLIRGDSEHIYQDEDQEELEYFGKSRTELPLGSPYMPSTPLVGSSQRYTASASGYSSRAGSRPTTPGPGTPSRLGPGTPKSLSKRAFELRHTPDRSAPVSPTTSSVQQTGQIDTGFSNYKIEWNWKELLGKKPRLWTAEAGEERYDPYSALSTHGSQADSDEDRHILESSDEDSEEESSFYHGRSGSEGSSSGGKGSLFAAGEDNDFTQESGFVIRGGKIARRRSSVALDRHDER